MKVKKREGRKVEQDREPRNKSYGQLIYYRGGKNIQ